MKWYKYILLLGLMVSSFSIKGQDVELQVDFIEVIGSLTPEDRATILTVSEEVLNKYYRYADLWDADTDQFSDEEYAEFLGLFLGSARVFDDVTESKTSMDYTDYADLIYENFSERQLSFDIDEAYLNTIEYDSVAGSYIATIEFVKILFAGLDGNGNFRTISEGNEVELTMQIDLPGYDLTEARIANVTGKESVKTQKLKENITYYTLSANYGVGFSSATAINETFDAAFNNFGITSSALGANLTVRRSLGRGNMNFIFGLGAKIISMESDISGYSNSGLDPNARIPDEVDGASSFAFNGVDLVKFQSSLTVNNIINGREKISVLAVEAPIGISFRLVDNFKSDFFVDVAVVPIYALSYSGDVTGRYDVINLPDSPHFPREEVLNNSTLLAAYEEEINLNQAINSSGSSFSVGVSISPSYAIELDDTYGIEIGGSFWYQVLPMFKEPVEPTDGYLKNILTPGNENSLLETYFKNVKTGLASVKIGFFYKLDSTL